MKYKESDFKVEDKVTLSFERIDKLDHEAVIWGETKARWIIKRVTPGGILETTKFRKMDGREVQPAKYRGFTRRRMKRVK